MSQAKKTQNHRKKVKNEKGKSSTCVSIMHRPSEYIHDIYVDYFHEVRQHAYLAHF